MKRVLFVCHGNICRSPMAHHVFQQMVDEAGYHKEFYINSAATHTDALGDSIYPPAHRKLLSEGVKLLDHRATLLTAKDYEDYDYIIAMDSRNVTNILRICGGDPQGKVFRLMDITSRPADVADPWYTGDFDATYEDVTLGCTALLEKLSK